ncbi:MAG: YtxH domain-containing protein [Candidatus Obscuribacterales bacterium]|nr:YtxH domain-containing protein [Candidatus Obscuribacterales bacterium]
MSNSNRFFEGLFLGGILGFIGGILCAPKSGAELRKELVDNSDELYKQANSSLSDIKDRTEQALQDFQSKGDSMIKQASSQFQETRDQLSSKIQEMGGKKTKIGLPEPESAQHM